jgi:hypothetical protein
VTWGENSDAVYGWQAPDRKVFYADCKERTVNLTNLTPAQSAVERVFTRCDMAAVEYVPMTTLAMF